MTVKALHVLSALAAFAVAAMAQASPFFFPPEANLPGWVTPFPYQRNIDFTFDDPLNVLAPHYEGTLDDQLKCSDEMLWEGHLWSLRWGDNFQHGAIGAYYDGNPDDADLNLRWRFDNVREPRPIKHIYIEMIYKWNDAQAVPVWESEVGQAVNTYWDITQPDFVEPGWSLWRGAYEIVPNPQWEVFGINIHLNNPGSSFWIDRLHVATECVPEPASLAVLSVALGGLLFRRRRQ